MYFGRYAANDFISKNYKFNDKHIKEIQLIIPLAR